MHPFLFEQLLFNAKTYMDAVSWNRGEAMPDENGEVQLALFADLPPGGEVREKVIIEPEPGEIWGLGDEPYLNDGFGKSS